MGREAFHINFYWKLPVWSIQALQRALCSLLRLCRAAVELCTFARSLKSGMDMCWSLSHSLQHLLLLIVSKWSRESRTQNLSPLQCGMSADSSRADFAQGR